MPKKILLLMTVITAGLVITACTLTPENKLDDNIINEEISLDENSTGPEIETAISAQKDSRPDEDYKTDAENIQLTVPVSVSDLKVGDKLGDFWIEKIEPLNTNLPFSNENFSIVLNGETTITGKLASNDYSGAFYVTPDETEKLPQITEKPNYNIAFPGNDSFFIGNANNQKIKITFKGLTLQSNSEPYFFDGSHQVINSEIIK